MVFVLPTIFSGAAWACPLCRAQVESGIYDQNFFDNLLMIVLPIVVITAIGLGLYHGDKILDRLAGRVK